LKKGKVETIYSPNLGNPKGLILSKWYIEPDDLIKQGILFVLLKTKISAWNLKAFIAEK